MIETKDFLRAWRAVAELAYYKIVKRIIIFKHKRRLRREIKIRESKPEKTAYDFEALKMLRAELSKWQSGRH